MTSDSRPVPSDLMDPTEPEEQQGRHPRLIAALRLFASWAAAIVLLIGALALIAGLPAFARLIPRSLRLAAIAPSVAIALSLAAISLLLKRSERAPSQVRAAATAAAVGALAIGLAYVVQYALGRDFGLDRLLSGPTMRAAGSVQPIARMAPLSAALFVAIGLSLLFVDTEVKRQRRPSQSFSVVVALFTIAAMGVSLFDSGLSNGNRPHTNMSGLTAFAFLLLALGTLAARPDRGAMRVITTNAVGGEVARRLLPAAFLAPLLLCILCYIGFLAKWYDSGFGLAILTTLNSTVLTALVWRTAGALNQADAHRRQIERERNELNVRLQRAMTETHHRVRNNLQIISALADMQVLSDRENVPVSEVKRIGAQVQALAAVHDLLTRESKVDAGADSLSTEEVLRKLADLLEQTATGRTICVRADSARITGRQASALVVVANELINNALKNSDSDIQVEFEVDNGRARLVVSDEGCGFAAGFDPVKEASTGLELVQQISGWDLQGSVRFANGREGGARVTVEMPLSVGIRLDQVAV